MTPDPDTIKFLDVFDPLRKSEYLALASGHQKFAYYTSAATAVDVLKNGEIWLRNSTLMNDFSEISYGGNLVDLTLYQDLGARFREAVEGTFSGTIEQVHQLYQDWKYDWLTETYLACVSKHHLDEDDNGRLSMWRAYGNIAIVVKNTPFAAQTDALGVNSLPVLYQGVKEFTDYLEIITKNILVERAYFLAAGQQQLVSLIHHFFFRTAVATKHPGFSEEQEWRIFCRPREFHNPIVESRVVVIGSVPQVIYALPLRDDPPNGLFGASVAELVDKIIIGPTAHPYPIYRALLDILARQGVTDPATRVVVSEIPLRVT